jgi:hypothetical protein
MTSPATAHEAPPSPPARLSRVVPVVLLVALLVALVTASVLASMRSGSNGELFGVRLGFTAADTRARFHAPDPGSWMAESYPSSALTWTTANDAAPVRRARFEFHSGILVAARFVVAAKAKEAGGPSVETTDASVIARRADSPDTVAVTLLSRDCPEHADEVRALLLPR